MNRIFQCSRVVLILSQRILGRIAVNDEGIFRPLNSTGLSGDSSTTHFNLIASGGFDSALLGIPGKGTFEFYKKNETSTDTDVPTCRIG